MVSEDTIGSITHSIGWPAEFSLFALQDDEFVELDTDKTFGDYNIDASNYLVSCMHMHISACAQCVI